MPNEQNRFAKNKDKKTHFSKNNELLGSDSTIKKYTLSLKPANVAILSPSFLGPALKQPKDDLHLIILTDESFYNTFENSEGKEDNKAGPALSGSVNRFIKIVKWDEIDKSKHSVSPLFATNEEAIDNIEVHFLWKLNELEDYKLENKDNELFAQIHPTVQEMYQGKGLIYGFELILQHIRYEDDGLYNISWMNYKKKLEKPEDSHFSELQDEYTDEYNTNYRTGFEFLKCDVNNADAPIFTEEKTLIQSYHPLYISKKESLDIGHLSDVHISSRQHVFTKSTARIIDGRPGSSNLSDEIGPMVNTSYATLSNLMEQMGDEATGIDLLIFTGDLIDYNRNLNPDIEKNNIKKSSDIWKVLNLDNLHNKQLYPVGIDNLVMYELFKKYYDNFNKPIMLVSGNHEAYTLPYGISPRFKFFRSLGNAVDPGKKVPLLDDNNQPMFDSEGNDIYITEKYTEEEVISNSTKTAEKDKKEIKDKDNPDIYYDRANEGIPADHNLTITEAVLMYGHDYARVVMGAASDEGGDRNFKPENLEWFYNIFTPLTSFTTRYNKQCFINLGWGDDEKFAGIKQGGWWVGGFLPRSTKSVSDVQLKLVKDSIDKESDSCNILCSHFTYANYDVPRPIEEEGEINYNDGFFGVLGKYDYGTFENNRSAIYENIVKHKIHYTLSGHSHRSGLYQVNNSDVGWFPGKTTMSITAKAAKNKKFSSFDQGKCKMLVAACGGPIAVQNHANELFNWGLDYPSGNYIRFGKNEIGIVIPDIKTVAQAQPRIAVALDYADIFLREKKGTGLFLKFGSNIDNGYFTISINPDANIPDTQLFYTASIYIYNNDIPYEISGEITLIKDKSNNDLEEIIKYKFSPKISIRKAMSKILKDNINSFIKLKCIKPNEIDNFEHYNYTKEWIYPIELFHNSSTKIYEYELFNSTELSDEEKNHIIDTVEGYTINRHRKYGEIPNFRWYSETFEENYANA